MTLLRQFFDIKNAIAVCAAPLEVLISILYWGIRLIDKNLLMPPDTYLPMLADLGFHAAPAVVLTLDLILFSPPWAIKMEGAMAISMALAFLYWGWVEYCSLMLLSALHFIWTHFSWNYYKPLGPKMMLCNLPLPLFPLKSPHSMLNTFYNTSSTSH